ncbi:MAG: N-acetylmuramoyl-L-alanine amidase [Paenisporosarcina sp.]
MVKIALDAGHGMNTPGKRSPTDEREWSFNDKVVCAAMKKLSEYENVQLLRTDDASGRADAPLAARTNQANDWKADIFVSVHHNALGTTWGDHEGAETFVYVPMSKNPKSKKLAECVHPRLVKAMQAKDRGIKDANFAVLRNSNMPAILTEGGFMDSREDIKKMRNDKFLKAQGEAIALGIVEYFGLKAKALPKPVVKPTSPKGKLYKVQVGAFGEKANADRLVKELQGKGYHVYIVET